MRRRSKSENCSLELWYFYFYILEVSLSISIPPQDLWFRNSKAWGFFYNICDSFTRWKYVFTKVLSPFTQHLTIVDVKFLLQSKIFIF